MGIGTGIAIYFIIWWTMIFITLPFRMRPQMETDKVVEGSDPAAPAEPQLFKRMMWNTALSAVVFIAYWLIFYVFDYGVEDLPDFLGVT